MLRVTFSAALALLTLPALAQTAAPGQSAPGQAPGQNGTPANQSPTGSTAPGTPNGQNTVNGPTNPTNTSGQTVNGQPTPARPGTGSLPRVADTSPRTYTLTQTIQAAIDSSSALQTAARNVEIDRARAAQNADAGKPTVGTSAQATRYDQATKISLGNSPPIETTKEHAEILSLTVGERLDVTGQIRAASNQARLQALADEFTLTQIRNDRVLQAQTIFFNLLRAEHQVQVAQAALQTAQTQQKLAQTLSAGQVGQKIDVYRANTQVATAQQDLTRAQNNLGIARSNFNDLVGRPLSAPSDAQDVPGVTVGEDVSTSNVPVSAPSSVAGTPFTVAPEEVAAINLDQSVQTALDSRPEIQAEEALVRAADLGIKLARAGLEPGLRLDASGNYYPTTSFQFPRQRTAAITATLTLPLYDGGLTRDRVKEARLRVENARTSLDSRRSDVTLDVRQTYLNLSTAAQQIDAANAALAQAVAARRLAQIRYEGQVGLYLEVTDAQAALVQAETNQVNAVYDYLTARAQFENAIGRPTVR